MELHAAKKNNDRVKEKRTPISPTPSLESFLFQPLVDPSILRFIGCGSSQPLANINSRD
jgi:hypothetical protein